MSRVVLKRNLVSAAPYEEKAWTEPSVNFSTGMFRPVLEEADELSCQIIQGSLPQDMPSGTYYRNGPNPFFAPKGSDAYHYFDGDGMIASFTISPLRKQVFFSHKWINTARLQADKEKNGSVYEFGGMATGNFVFKDALDKRGVRMGKANTSLVFHNNKLLALEEADLPYVVDPKNLETLGPKYTFESNSGRHKNVFKQNNNRHNIFTAHPKLDSDTQELIGYGCAYDPTKFIFDYYVIAPDGTLATTFPIHLKRTAYTHDFAITKHYSLCFDGNLILNWNNVFEQNKSAGKKEGMWQFDDSTPGRIGIFPRYATSEEEVVWFDVEPFCVSHTVNAYEEGDTIVLICNNIGYEGFQPSFPVETPRDPLANLHLWRFNLSTKQVYEKTLRANIRSDFPVINLQYVAKKNRYLYAQLVNYEEPNHAPYLFGAYKYDLQTNSYKEEIWKSSDDSKEDGGKFYGSEGIFVPRLRNVSQSHEEDYGYMLVLVNNVNKRRTELRIYDCKSFGEANSLKCTVASPRRLIPLGTHGIWLDEDKVMGKSQKSTK